MCLNHSITIFQCFTHNKLICSGLSPRNIPFTWGDLSRICMNSNGMYWVMILLIIWCKLVRFSAMMKVFKIAWFVADFRMASKDVVVNKELSSNPCTIIEISIFIMDWISDYVLLFHGVLFTYPYHRKRPKDKSASCPTSGIMQRFGSTLSQVMICCWQHQAITWTNVDLSSVRSSDNHLSAISQEITPPLITKLAWILLT